MDPMLQQELGDAERIAIQYTPVSLRLRLATFFALDRRLGQIVAQTSEPMLGQMRIAWWRDILRRNADDRPSGDMVLDAIGAHWSGTEEYLIPLVDGWEHMLTDAPLQRGDACAFVNGRIAPLTSIARGNAGATIAARRWACADATAHTGQETERALFIDLGAEDADRKVRLPKELRGLAVLSALGMRALKREGRPLMEGRGAAITALRAGIIGW